MEENFKTSVGRSLKSKKLHMFGVFLALAFIFLVLTKFSKTYVERIPLDIEFHNLPAEETLLENKENELQVEISAVGFRILAYYFKDKTIHLDLADNTNKTDSTYIWQPQSTDKLIREKIGYAVDILSIRPDSMVIPFARLDSKKVPIKLRKDIGLSPGFDLVDKVSIMPDSVTVIGAAANLKEVDSILTEEFVVSDASADIREKLNLILPETENIKLKDSTTEVIVNINKFTEGTLQIPVTIINRPSKVKINYFPKSVPVSFYVDLKRFNEVQPEDFTIVCDFNDVRNSNKTFFTPRLIEYPEFVRSAKIKLEKIEFIITK